jgi:hypothetical protein
VFAKRLFLAIEESEVFSEVFTHLGNVQRLAVGAKKRLDVLEFLECAEDCSPAPAI